MSAVENTPQAWSERARTAASPQEAAGWTAAGQADRFTAVLEALSPRPGEMLLDYGCGTGALVDRLPPGVGYIGYDWAEGMVERARADHPRSVFVDRFYNMIQVDLVAAVGTFNLPGGKQATWHQLRSLWYDLEPRALAVSLYAGADERCLRYTVHEATQHLEGLSHDVRVAKWRHNDILAVVNR